MTHINYSATRLLLSRQLKSSYTSFAVSSIVAVPNLVEMVAAEVVAVPTFAPAAVDPVGRAMAVAATVAVMVAGSTGAVGPASVETVMVGAVATVAALVAVPNPAASAEIAVVVAAVATAALVAVPTAVAAEIAEIDPSVAGVVQPAEH